MAAGPLAREAMYKQGPDPTVFVVYRREQTAKMGALSDITNRPTVDTTPRAH